jgi:hypothetical protein
MLSGAGAGVSAFDNPHQGDEIMKSIRRFPLFKALVLTIAAMGASAIPASAQTTTGTFTLAHKVRWAGAVLPPGSYAFSVDSQAWPDRVTVRQVGGPMVVMLLPQAMSDDTFASSSSLILHEEDGESVVSALRLKPMGVALEFASPKLAMPVAETAGLGPIAESGTTK